MDNGTNSKDYQDRLYEACLKAFSQSRRVLLTGYVFLLLVFGFLLNAFPGWTDSRIALSQNAYLLFECLKDVPPVKPDKPTPAQDTWKLRENYFHSIKSGDALTLVPRKPEFNKNQIDLANQWAAACPMVEQDKTPEQRKLAVLKAIVWIDLRDVNSRTVEEIYKHYFDFAYSEQRVISVPFTSVKIDANYLSILAGLGISLASAWLAFTLAKEREIGSELERSATENTVRLLWIQLMFSDPTSVLRTK